MRQNDPLISVANVSKGQGDDLGTQVGPDMTLGSRMISPSSYWKFQLPMLSMGTMSGAS